jgi:hypothetical protein
MAGILGIPSAADFDKVLTARIQQATDSLTNLEGKSAGDIKTAIATALAQAQTDISTDIQALIEGEQKIVSPVLAKLDEIIDLVRGGIKVTSNIEFNAAKQTLAAKNQS